MSNVDVDDQDSEEISFNDFIQDKSGNLYEVEVSRSSTHIHLDVYTDTNVSGRVYCVIDQDTNQITLWDVYISEYIGNKPILYKLLPFLVWNKPNYRNKGLGSAMLKYAIEQAKIMKVNSIVGNISGEDLEKTPYLIEFYQKHGFTIDSRMNIYLEL